MSEALLSITYLNDFIFCPVSIYFHNLDSTADPMLLQETSQINGSAAHIHSDHGTYSDRKSVLQGISVYCERYGLIGKIDTFDQEKGQLTERKKKIRQIYDGYIFQIYAQYFALTEMGYTVRELRLYSMDDNQIYPIPLPEQNPELFARFEKVIEAIQNFDFRNFHQPNGEKCRHCIYEPLCSYSKEVLTYDVGG